MLSRSQASPQSAEPAANASSDDVVDPGQARTGRRATRSPARPRPAPACTRWRPTGSRRWWPPKSRLHRGDRDVDDAGVEDRHEHADDQHGQRQAPAARRGGRRRRGGRAGGLHRSGRCGRRGGSRPGRGRGHRQIVYGHHLSVARLRPSRGHPRVGRTSVMTNTAPRSDTRARTCHNGVIGRLGGQDGRGAGARAVLWRFLGYSPGNAARSELLAGADATPGQALTRVMNELVFHGPSRRLAQAHADGSSVGTGTGTGTGRTYAYDFGWRSPACGGGLGACHGLELPFVFDTLATATGRPGSSARTTRRRPSPTGCATRGSPSRATATPGGRQAPTRTGSAGRRYSPRKPPDWRCHSLA